MTIRIKHPSLEKLWQISNFLTPYQSCAHSPTFCDVGLWLETPSKDEHYSCTPTNSLRFACTGGDGVHFSLVEIDGWIIEESPVVMTVPMMDDTNLIVGENLCDFLALGCKFGYFELEQLAYDEKETLELLGLRQFSECMGQNEKKLLELISQSFDNLHPWPDPKKRFADLQKKYSLMLEIDTSEDE